MEMQIGLLFMPADVVGIAASTLARLGYSATEQALLKAILFAIQHPKSSSIMYTTISGLVGAGSGILQGSTFPQSPEIPLFNSSEVNLVFDYGTLLGNNLYNFIYTLNHPK